MNRLLCVALLLSVMVATGCSYSQTVKDSWKFTKRQYYSYINTPADLDLDDKGSASSYQVALGEVVLETDTTLHGFMRAMSNADVAPGPEWVMSMFSNFPWLSDIALVGATGEVHSRFPTENTQALAIAPLLEEDPKQNMLAVRTYASLTEGQQDVYVGKPVYIDGEFRGLVVARFDMANLVQSSSADMSQIAIFSPHGTLWRGSAAPVSGLGDKDWADELLRRSSGYGGSDGSEYYWTTHYLGNMPVVYAIATSAEPVLLNADDIPSGTTASAPIPREVVNLPEEQ